MSSLVERFLAWQSQELNTMLDVNRTLLRYSSEMAAAEISYSFQNR